MDKTRELMAQGLLNMLMVAWYGERLSHPERGMSSQVSRYYSKGEYPDWLAEELKTIEIVPATNIAIEVAARVDDTYSYVFRNSETSGLYGCYAKLLDFACMANVMFGKVMTEEQIAYWIFASIEKNKRYKFAARKAEEIERKVQKTLILARDDDVSVDEFKVRIGKLRRSADFWHDMAERTFSGGTPKDNIK